MASRIEAAEPGAGNSVAGYFPYALGGAALGYAAARRGRGRRATWGSSFDRDLKSANVFLMDWVCDGWGKLPPKIQRIADKKRPLTDKEKETLVEWFRATAPGSYT